MTISSALRKISSEWAEGMSSGSSEILTILRTSGRFAFCLDSELNWGSSEVSQTFLNRRLSNNEEFHCHVVEVWGFEHY